LAAYPIRLCLGALSAWTFNFLSVVVRPKPVKLQDRRR
jgi:hypothetical protein